MREMNGEVARERKKSGNDCAKAMMKNMRLRWMLRKRRSLRSKRFYTVQYSTVQYSTVQHCTVRYCGVRHRTHLQIYILWPKQDRTLDALYRK